ncbi:DUF2325 domain-containing protein [Dechloromonas denitrificans]|uniref:DUF2325 domain-containing protein n=1 Tax=Dechloromonas denitrificans TaxID=281362 RepID=UPI001CF8D328|nr:DUF2325 domain-containing protein [Dechloromonas denitrificans]UCV12769.1 DUF2325 domain-containing protein [Dechloromonas denitrificans]
MSDFPFHVAGGVFGGGNSIFLDAVALPLKLPTPKVSSSRRRKLWEIPHKFHCPVIGVCFDCDELRRLMNKVMHLPGDASDFVLHTTAVGNCEERSRLSEILHKTLEKRCELMVRRYAIFKTDADLRAAWRAACKEGRDIPMALWVCWTHPACSEQLEQEIYADIHMIQHQLGSHVRTDQKAMKALQLENADLCRRLDAAQADIEALRKKRAAQANEAAQMIARLRADLVAKEACATHASRESALLRETMVPDTELHRTLVQRLAESEVRARKSKQLAEELAQEVGRLRDFAKYAEETIDSLTREDDALSAIPETHLSGKCVLCVGGRSGAVHSYREMVEQSGGRFMHHDGGLEESMHRIDGVVAAADIVICQAGCISHNAYWRVKEHCKRTGKPCMFVKTSGVTSFGRVVNELGKKI